MTGPKNQPAENEKTTSNPAWSSDTKKSWYAWVIFGAAFFMVFVSLGFGSSTKGTFLTSVTGSLGLARSKYTIGDALRYVTTAVLSLFFGRTEKKIGIRMMALFGFIFMTLSFLINGFAPKITDVVNSVIPETNEGLRDLMRYIPFYLGGILLGAGFAWASTTLASVIVRRWFASGQGTVTGIVLAANGLGGFASEIIVTKIIFGADGSLSNEASHWQKACFVIAGLMFVVGILVWMLFRNEPSDIGQEAFRLKESKKKSKKTGDWEGLTAKEAFRKPWFYLAGLGFFLVGFCVQSMSNIAKPYIYDLGYEKSFVILVFSIHSLLLVVGKILTGVGNDTIGIRKTYAVCTFAAMVAFLSLFFLPRAGSGQFGEILFPWVYSAVSSFGLPLETVMISLMAAYLFGRKDFARIMGYYLALTTFGCAIGAPVANLFYDIQGTYKWIVLALAVMTAMTALLHEVIMGYVDKKYRKPALLGKAEREQSLS